MKGQDVLLDKDWMELIQEALKLGLTPREIRTFLHKESKEKS